MHTKIQDTTCLKLLRQNIKMGCDGGTIPKRDELVRTKKKPEQVNC